MVFERLLAPLKPRARRAVSLNDLPGFRNMSSRQRDTLRMSLSPGGADEDANCHLAAFHLENGAKSPAGPTRGEDLRRFQHVGYAVGENLSLAALQSQIERAGFPCIVVPGERKQAGGAPVPLHTLVALGYEHGEMKVWEKQGFAGVPHTATLKEVYARYSSDPHIVWSTRRMITPKEGV